MCFRNGITRQSSVLIVSTVQFVHGFGTFFSALVSKRDLNSASFLALVMVAILNMSLAVVLFIGAYRSRPTLLLIWLGWAATVVVGFVISTPFIGLYVHKFVESNGGITFSILSTLIILVLSFCMECFCAFLVYKLYKDLVADTEEKDGPIVEQNDHHTRPSTMKSNKVAASEANIEPIKIEEKY